MNISDKLQFKSKATFMKLLWYLNPWSKFLLENQIVGLLQRNSLPLMEHKVSLHLQINVSVETLQVSHRICRFLGVQVWNQ